MSRFFSKLDLRDVKIDPKGSSFPPDEDGYQEFDQAAARSQNEAEHSDEAETGRQPYAPAWAEAPVVEPSADAIDANGFGAPTSAATVEERFDGEVTRNGEVLKVSARSRPSAVAGAIAGVVRENGRAEVQAIGAGATNQAVKAVAIARDYLRETGIEAVCLPAFIDVTIDNEDRTAIRLVVEPR